MWNKLLAHSNLELRRSRHFCECTVPMVVRAERQYFYHLSIKMRHQNQMSTSHLLHHFHPISCHHPDTAHIWTKKQNKMKFIFDCDVEHCTAVSIINYPDVFAHPIRKWGIMWVVCSIWSTVISKYHFWYIDDPSTRPTNMLGRMLWNKKRKNQSK